MSATARRYRCATGCVDRVQSRRPGRLAQRESASFTPKRPLVRSQYRPHTRQQVNCRGRIPKRGPTTAATESRENFGRRSCWPGDSRPDRCGALGAHISGWGTSSMVDLEVQTSVGGNSLTPAARRRRRTVGTRPPGPWHRREIFTCADGCHGWRYDESSSPLYQESK